ncbi:MAG: selenide, water dikinase SelD [Bacteroidetes bacterium]|nr:selenide, water dikinase SelD [Bacteroidota bacterium]
MSEIKLTQYSHSSGCGCKIAPQVLEEILRSDAISPIHNKLIVGNTTNDDAAVYDMGNGTGLISTTDFFMPIVDDAYDFGRIASANALSDVYAMGGHPTLALAILGWPVNKLPVELAKKVIEGARSICLEAGIPLAGGHSIDTLEPMFGLSANGIVELKNLKQNSTAKEGDLIYITKKIGVGILSTATKRNLLKEEHRGIAVEQMVKLNKFGTELAKITGVTAMTDVTGFGLLGHLIEIAAGSGLSAELYYSKVPLIEGLAHYTTQMCVPDNTFKNWNAYEQRTEGISAESLLTLCDPQTNGGLLFTIVPSLKNEVEGLMKANGLGEFAQPIGLMKKKDIKTISII